MLYEFLINFIKELKKILLHWAKNFKVESLIFLNIQKLLQNAKDLVFAFAMKRKKNKKKEKKEKENRIQQNLIQWAKTL